MTDLHLHAHVSKSARDCDGPIYDEYIISLTDEERARSEAANGVNDFTDIEFRNRVLTSIVSVYATQQGRMDVNEGGFKWHEDTDEGYRAAEVVWCEDESCDPAYTSHRDVYAEMMGY